GTATTLAQGRIGARRRKRARARGRARVRRGLSQRGRELERCSPRAREREAMLERDVLSAERWRPLRLVRFAWHFAVAELRSLLFAAAIFAGLAVTSVVSLPIPRYDALLVYGLLLTLVLYLTGWETGR